MINIFASRIIYYEKAMFEIVSQVVYYLRKPIKGMVVGNGRPPQKKSKSKVFYNFNNTVQKFY